MSVPFVDGFGRRVKYLRLSVTDRCDLRCRYCMSEAMTFLPSKELLMFEELDRVARCFIASGVEKIRVTGGEPLVRKEIMQLFRSLSQYLADGRLRELTLTTNATQLSRYAEELAALGVRRVNVSLDTLDPDKFTMITRGGLLARVLEGIAAAQAAGLAVKLNAVALKGFTEDAIDDLIGFAHAGGMTLTLIETMPLGEIGADRTDQFLPLSSLRRQIEQRWTLVDLAERTGGPARYVRVIETGGKVGFITPMTSQFLRGLQPRACDGLRRAAPMPWASECGRSQAGVARRWRRCRRDAGDRTCGPRQAARPRFPDRARRTPGAGAAYVGDGWLDQTACGF